MEDGLLQENERCCYGAGSPVSPAIKLTSRLIVITADSTGKMMARASMTQIEIAHAIGYSALVPALF